MTPNELIDAANNGRAVSGFHAHNFKPMPAAFVVSMQFRVVMSILSRLQIYHKLPCPKKPRRRKKL